MCGRSVSVFAAGLKRNQNRLDIFFLRVWNQPVDGHAVILFDEDVLLAADGIVALLVGEKFVKRAAQRGQNVFQRRERRRGLIAFQLGDEALGKHRSDRPAPSAVKLFFWQETSQLAADVDAHKNASRFSRA